jgi:hypothetical protein
VADAARRGQPREVRGGADLLEIVEHEEHLLGPDEVDQRRAQIPATLLA